jgi:hypothetical protein
MVFGDNDTRSALGGFTLQLNENHPKIQTMNGENRCENGLSFETSWRKLQLVAIREATLILFLQRQHNCCRCTGTDNLCRAAVHQ